MRTQNQWTGSNKTYKAVKAQIVKRFGAKAGAKYDPLKNCFTYREWKRRGYQVQKGQKAIRSITFASGEQIKDPETGKVESKTYRSSVNLFYIAQVAPLNQVNKTV